MTAGGKYLGGAILSEARYWPFVQQRLGELTYLILNGIQGVLFVLWGSARLGVLPCWNMRVALDQVPAQRLRRATASRSAEGKVTGTHCSVRITMAERTRPCEDLAVATRREGRAVGGIASRKGLWSQRHIKRVVLWAEHVVWPPNAISRSSA